MKPIIVIKLGGSSLVNSETLFELSTLIKGYQKRRSNVVIIHGGGPAINQELQNRKISWRFIEGQRQTTPEMMLVINEVLAERINSMLVQTLRAENIQSVGLSGSRNQILHCSRASEELMQVGKVDSVDSRAILACLQDFKSCVPVIAPIGIGENGELFNVNADWAATQIALALKATKLIFLTDQKGILNEEKQLVSKANSPMLQKMIEEGSISGGMCTKVRAMMAAVNSGLKQVRVLHASQSSELLNNEGMGTVLTQSKFHKAKDIIHGRAS